MSDQLPSPGIAALPETAVAGRDARRVMVVHGRNDAARRAMFDFLRALDLQPLEWGTLVGGTGNAAPYTGDVLKHAFGTAAAVVVLLTPDDEARLREPFRVEADPPYEARLTPQPRANVLFEAGMALGVHPERTIIVEMGEIRPFTNIDGRNVVRLTGTLAELEEIASRLETAGCAVDRSGRDWTSTERFDAALHKPDARTHPHDLIDAVGAGKSRSISRFLDIGWNDALSLVNYPEVGGGWPLEDVRFTLDPVGFTLPPDRREAYESWRSENWEQERLYDDGSKYMVLENPIASTDSPTLKLRLGKTRYSEALFHHQASSPRIVEEWVSRLVQGDLRAVFAHSFCMHAIVISADDYILLTERSPKVSYGRGTWSASCEESLADVDMADGMEGVAARWAGRLLDEELGLDDAACDEDSMRLLSIFVEADLPNISACVGIRLNLSRRELESRIQAGIRSDTELTSVDFLPATRRRILQELKHPGKRYHPTSGYRLLMATLWLHGAVARTEI